MSSANGFAGPGRPAASSRRRSTSVCEFPALTTDEPTDPEDERIEVGVAIVGGGPAGSPAPTAFSSLLADEPELMERLGEVPVAVIEKGKVCGAHTLSGREHAPSAMRELFPDIEPFGLAVRLPGGDQGRRLPADRSARRCR